MQGKQTWPVLSLAEATARLTAPGGRFETVPALIRGQAMTVWKNVPATAADLFGGLRGFADRECLVYQGERITYDAFSRAVLSLAAALQRDGVQKGDRVALVMRNLPEWPVVFLAGLLCGAILVPLNAWWTAAELGFALADCGARIIFTDGGRLARVLEAAPPGARILASRAPDAALKLEDLIGAPTAWSALPDGVLPHVPLQPEDDATIFYTSGTTANPKGALGTHRNLTTNIFATPFSTARNALRAGVESKGARRAILIAIPLFHVTAALSALLPSLAAGGKIVLMRKFEAEAALALIAREGITVTGGVPTVALSLLDCPARDQHDLSSLSLLSYGGAPSPTVLADRIARSLPHAAPGNAWGMTETSATCTIHSGPDYRHRPESCGPVLPVGRIKVMADGCEAPPGTVGELWAFGPNVVKGYWNRPEESAAVFIDGWVRTGDMARIDVEGFCTIVDRAKDMVIRGGENIYCIEVEHVLAAHPMVAEAALVGLDHPLLGEVPAAMVRTRGPVSQDEILAFAAARLAPFKLPVRLLLSDAPLPRNENGKVMKAALKAAFA